jgi:hypothetical protein
VAIAKKWEEETPERKRLEDTKTYKRLGYTPRTLDEGLVHTLEWLRDLGKVDAA